MKMPNIPKEIQIAVVVIFFSALTYILVEPFAHSQMHKDVKGNDFLYDGKDDIKEIVDAKEMPDKNETTKRKEAREKREIKRLALKNKKIEFWANINKLSTEKGDVVKGEAAFGICTSCHNGAGVAMGGVIPPSLDHSGYLYNKKYLISLLKDPVMASNLNHKYEDGKKSHPMGIVVSDEKEIINIVAYMLEKKSKVPTPKIAFKEACLRCHSMRYAKSTTLGDIPKFTTKIDKLHYEIKVIEALNELKEYLDVTPPDLSTIIKSRNKHYLQTFIENPQSQMPKTGMPRVGLSKVGYEKVEEYLTEVGDPSKEERERIGIWVILFFFVFTILAYLWKKENWKDL